MHSGCDSLSFYLLPVFIWMFILGTGSAGLFFPLRKSLGPAAFAVTPALPQQSAPCCQVHPAATQETLLSCHFTVPCCGMRQSAFKKNETKKGLILLCSKRRWWPKKMVSVKCAKRSVISNCLQHLSKRISLKIYLLILRIVLEMGLAKGNCLGCLHRLQSWLANNVLTDVCFYL